MRAKRITQISLFQLDYVNHPIGQALKAASAIIDEHPEWTELIGDDEMYVFAQSHDRIANERAMRKRQLKRLWARLAKLPSMKLSREALLMKLGAA